MKAPVILLCQNNGWAISTTIQQQTASETLAQKAIAYGFPGVQCDGNDLFAVYATVRDAVRRARDGEGPTLVEALTYRLGLHTTADDPTRYEPLEMERDERVLVFGEDVGIIGGVFRATDGLFEKYGNARVIDVPLAEGAIAGAAIGLALAGWVPVAEIQFLGFAHNGFNQVVDQL